MVTLKFQRIGKKKQAFFRLIVQDKRKDPQDKALEILGWYNPRTKEKKLENERIKYYLAQGAEATPTVNNLLIDVGLLTGPKLKTFKISRQRKDKLAGQVEKTAAAEAMPETPAEKPIEEKKTETKEEAPAEIVAPVVENTPTVETPPAPEEKKEEKVEESPAPASPNLGEPAPETPTA